jgi:hypothetical protein
MNGWSIESIAAPEKIRGSFASLRMTSVEVSGGKQVTARATTTTTTTATATATAKAKANTGVLRCAQDDKSCGEIEENERAA